MEKVTKKELIERVNEQELRIYRIEKALKQSGIKWTVSDKVELTGSDLCRAMLARGDKYVMCIVSEHDDAVNIDSVIFPKVIYKHYAGFFMATDSNWLYAIPVNNQGEPLTATDVGL